VNGEARATCAQKGAVLQTNIVGHLLHLAWGWCGWHDLGNGCLGCHCGLVIGNAWLLLMWVIDSGSRGVTNHKKVPFVTGLSVTGLCSTSNSKGYDSHAVEGSGYGRMGLGGAVYTC
jgi:hypothetical protein